MTGEMTPERPAARGGTRPLAVRLLGWGAFFAFLGMLLYNTFNVTPTQARLGAILVTVAVRPEPAEVGPAILHIQLSTADGEKPVSDYQVNATMVGSQASAVEVLKKTNHIPVSMKATAGAYEAHFTVPPSGSVELEVHITGPAPAGSLRYRIEAGKKGATLISSVPGGSAAPGP